ncbi:hypothetical protein Pla22_28880 [Rubripirellula amarantea]|uniref:Uncharacterized protein n=1 Tax=Rubripirellula amarantea TaxID=2527999 RepID=A0A5C5WH84_9BACT|nr:hypothetical protein Pla22_28880 [Rubripirellula amarantea]
MIATSPFWPFGLNRMLSVDLSSSELLTATVPMSVQPEPVLNCQVPLVPLVEKIAMPSESPSASVMRSPPSLAMISAMVFPLFPASSSEIVSSEKFALLSSVGASLSPVTVTYAVAVEVPPLPSLTW